MVLIIIISIMVNNGKKPINRRGEKIKAEGGGLTELSRSMMGWGSVTMCRKGRRHMRGESLAGLQTSKPLLVSVVKQMKSPT